MEDHHTCFPGARIRKHKQLAVQCPVGAPSPGPPSASSAAASVLTSPPRCNPVAPLTAKGAVAPSACPPPRSPSGHSGAAAARSPSRVCAGADVRAAVPTQRGFPGAAQVSCRCRRRCPLDGRRAGLSLRWPVTLAGPSSHVDAASLSAGVRDPSEPRLLGEQFPGRSEDPVPAAGR